MGQGVGLHRGRRAGSGEARDEEVPTHHGGRGHGGRGMEAQEEQDRRGGASLGYAELHPHYMGTVEPFLFLAFGKSAALDSVSGTVCLLFACVWLRQAPCSPSQSYSLTRGLRR